MQKIQTETAANPSNEEKKISQKEKYAA